jgi:DNA-binding transcriptional regulator PaaX
MGAGILIISTVSPRSGALMVKNLIKTYFRKKSFEKYRFLTDLKNLQTRKLINYQELDDGRIRVELTKGGRRELLIYKLDEMKLAKPQHWDKKWRLVLFDIPHGQKKARDALRDKLKNLDFYPLQRSVFLTPFPCEKEIDFIGTIFNVRKYILIVYANHFEGEEKFRHYFKI